MPSRISLFNREIIRQITRSVGWVGIVYFLGLVVALPLRLLMQVSSEYPNYQKYENLFQVDFPIQMLFILTIPVLLAIFLFRFLHVKQQADLIHSLPLKRSTIFHQYTLIGAVLLVTPVILTMLVVLIVYNAFDLKLYFEIAEIFYWGGVTVLISLVLFLAAVFVGMFTGITAVHGGLSYIFLVFPAGIVFLLVSNLGFFLLGFPDSYYLHTKIETFSPFTYALVLETRVVSPAIASIYAVLIGLLYAGSLFFYKKRQVEAVSQAIAFEKLTPVFKYGAAFCFMLLGGIYFGNIGMKSSWWIFGYVAGSILGYFIAEMVLQKTWRVFRNIKGYFIFVGVIALSFGASQLIFNQYEKNVPELSEVKQVYVSDMPYQYVNSEDYESELTFTLKEPENVQAVLNLHRSMINTPSANKESIFFAYELENGKKIVREYEMNQNDFYELLKPIKESIEYKHASNEIFLVDAEEADKITITPRGLMTKHAVIADSKDIKEAITILKKEAELETYEQMDNYSYNNSEVELLLDNDKRVFVEWKQSYKQFEKWLDDKGLLAQASLLPEDINYILVANKRELVPDPYIAFDDQTLLKQLEEEGKIFKAEDKGGINSILTAAETHIDGEFIVALYFHEKGHYEIASIKENKLPDFIKDYFDK
ncbi:multidrug ABC transporter permease [Bacillus sp. V3-13]|uniref:DUF6449 domain-containing protein n=1 Tax=Bacillus sp. V3-13 TaxID=2053728 RepID=UPI000C78FA9D|nr:DUF6449 domain-containing protein [Bacillus sp. V3-13]PLR76638.1 multidrug ABC transporter permease [Bacillus sp. V3-13]